MTGNRQYSDSSAQLVSGQYAHSGAPGTAPAREQPADATAAPEARSGLPNVGTQVPLNAQMGYGESLSANQPGQLGGVAFAGADAAQVGDTGAGGGTVDHWRRRPGQQGPGAW